MLHDISPTPNGDGCRSSSAGKTDSPADCLLADRPDWPVLFGQLIYSLVERFIRETATSVSPIAPVCHTNFALRPAITFDILFRYLRHLGYKVRYVRNITDVGHLEHDADSGEDKIAKKARLEQLEPMEVVQMYLNRYHHDMEALNVLPKHRASCIRSYNRTVIEYVKRILDSGYAYESNGSVYFDVEKYNRDHRYGKLSGRNIEDLLSTTRALDGQEEKRNPLDFALWKKPRQNISCTGTLPGAKVSRGGISNAPR